MDLKETALGIEFGSTRIKATLIDSSFRVVAEGSYEWENQFVDGLWSYSQSEIIHGLQTCYASLKEQVYQKYHEVIHELACIGISAMMHGYIALDKNDQLLVPFRTWRNNNTTKAATYLTELFQFHIPERWSVSHLYQAILNQESHISQIAFQTTLAGYVHYLLTGRKVLGIGDASGMFPMDSKCCQYDKKMKKKFNSLLKEKGLAYSLDDIFPEVLLAGEDAGELTKNGALLLDPTGDLQEGITLCPPEGDAGTGMVATNSVAPSTGNVSAGTSIFGMIVLEHSLKNYYPEIDLVTTPTGKDVAMVHCNNCTSEINAWVNLFDSVAKLVGSDISKGELFAKLFMESLKGKADCGNILTYNYLSGENITGVEHGRPLVVKKEDSEFTLANFMKAQIYAAFATLKYGMDIVFVKEGLKAKELFAHGGIFTTKGVAQNYLAAALNTSITCMNTANVGGSYGMALLAMYRYNGMEDLETYLNQKVFAQVESVTVEPDRELVAGFNQYMEQFKQGLSIEKEAQKWGE